MLQSVWIVGSLIESVAADGWHLVMNVTPEATMLVLWGGLLLAVGRGVRQKQMQTTRPVERLQPRVTQASPDSRPWLPGAQFPRAASSTD